MLVSNIFSKFKTWKTVFIYINIFLSEPPLIKIPCLLILDTFVGPRGLPPSLIWHCEEYVFKIVKIEVFLVITGCGKKKRNVRFLVWWEGVAVCGPLLVVSVRLLVVGLLVVCGGLWSLPVLVTTLCVLLINAFIILQDNSDFYHSIAGRKARWLEIEQLKRVHFILIQNRGAVPPRHPRLRPSWELATLSK